MRRYKISPASVNLFAQEVELYKLPGFSFFTTKYYLNKKVHPCTGSIQHKRKNLRSKVTKLQKRRK
jgi:hypothetical protein